MTVMTAPVRRRIGELVDHFLAKQRPEAAVRLIDSIEQIMESLDRDPDQGRTFPGPYRTLTAAGVRWVKVHRYWFGHRWEAERGTALLVQILYDQADMPRRLLPDGPVVPWGG